ncbi:MAG: hypothetical protein IKA82_01855 [Clostridia bacterium]|nr:hypothetical protein [Clostridia bacterium]
MAPKIKGMNISQQKGGFALSCLSNDSYKLFVVSIDAKEIMGENDSNDILLSREAVKKYAFKIIEKAYHNVWGVEGDIDAVMKDTVISQSSALGSEEGKRFAFYDHIIHKDYEKTTSILIGRFDPEDKVFVFVIYDNNTSVMKAVEGEEGKDYLCRLIFINKNEREYILQKEEVKQSLFDKLFKKKKVEDEIGPVNVCVAYKQDEDSDTHEVPDGIEPIFFQKTERGSNVYSRIFNYGGELYFPIDYLYYKEVEEGTVKIVSLASIISNALNN